MVRKVFTLDRQNKMAFGVCAGIARHFNIDPTFVRVGVVLVTLLGAFPWTLVAYAAAVVLAKAGRKHVRDDRLSTNDLRLNTRDIDRRMAEVDAYVGSNDRLAREIEMLRDGRNA